MKKICLLILTILFCASCQSYDHGHGLSALGAAGAGTLAWKLTEGKSPTERMAWTAASTLGTFAFGQYVRGKIIESEKKRYEAGYQMGLTDAAKRQYEIIQNRQKENSPSQRNKFSLYEFPGVESRNGVNFAPHSVKLRVME